MYVIGSTYPGLAHEERKQPSEDHFSSVFRKGVLSSALCDGAGSYQFAGWGALNMSRFMASWVADHFNTLFKMSEDQIKMKAAEAVEHRLQKIRSRFCNRTDANAFASTLLCAAVKASTGECLTIQLGDGLIAVRKNGEAFVPVTQPSYSADSRATALTTIGWVAMLLEMQVNKGYADSVLLCTDGGEFNIYDPSNGRVLPRGMVLEKYARKLDSNTARKLLSLAVEKFRGDDDLSVCLMLPTPNRREVVDRWVNDGSRRAKQERKRMLAFAEYECRRSNGISPASAARMMGWGMKASRKAQEAEACIKDRF